MQYNNPANDGTFSGAQSSQDGMAHLRVIPSTTDHKPISMIQLLTPCHPIPTSWCCLRTQASVITPIRSWTKASEIVYNDSLTPYQGNIMSKYRVVFDANHKAIAIQTSFKHRRLLQTPLLNKGSAFTREEREMFELSGLLPYQEETLDQQANRMYDCYQNKQSDIEKHIFLRRIHDSNYTLFYHLIHRHIEEMLPIIYTPTIGEAVRHFSHLDLQPRGLFIAYPQRDHLDNILAQYHDTPIRIVVITDGEGVLGIGDQGAGGINIVMAKGAVYSLCAGIDPFHVLPIQLDCGTNNQALLDDPDYLGWRHKRIEGDAYNTFVSDVIKALQRHFPQSYLHWEDFGRSNARRFLEQYKHQLCSFNDDIQGTGAVALATILTALNHIQQPLTDQTILIFGAGTAGIGIADQIHQGLVALGKSSEEAYAQIWLIDRPGVLTHDMTGLTTGQKPYAQTIDADWTTDERGHVTLPLAIPKIKPTILIGCSAQKGSFTQGCITEMMQHCPNPIIMPLSNPTDRAEATPADILTWTQGQAFIATGSPFSTVTHAGKTYAIAQCNNVFIFPGLGLGATLCQASTISNTMLMAACQSLAAFTHRHHQGTGRLLPKVTDCQSVNKEIAKAVVHQAMQEGLANKTIEDIDATIEHAFWTPTYLPYHWHNDPS